MFPCPHCGATTPEVLESRLQRKQLVRRRRYECPSCKSRFTTYERLFPDQTKAEKVLARIETELAAVRLEISQAPPPAPVPIQELERGAYAYGLLKRQGVTTVDALVKFSGADLLSLRNFGHQLLDDVRVALALRGLALRRE